MSNTIDEIMSALANARDAMTERDALATEVSNLRQRLEASQIHAQELELKCGVYREEIDKLNTKLRSVEAERDEYGFQNLAQADLVDSLEAKCNVLRNHIQNVMEVVENLKPRPKPTPPLTDSPVPPPMTQQELMASTRPYDQYDYVNYGI